MYHAEVRRFILLALLALAIDTRAQEAQDKCSQIRYSAPSPHALGYRLQTIAGQAVYASPSQKWEAGPAGGVCVSLFKLATHDLVANSVTDDKGQFQFAGMTAGEYTLIAAAGDLQPISIRVRITARMERRNSPRLLLHLREQTEKRKSYVTEVSNPALRQELLSMIERDQNIRDEMINAGVDHPSKDVMSRMDEIDNKNTLRMKSIIKQYGWPSVAVVGWDGAEAAFILVQHADAVTHNSLLPLITKQYKAGNVSGPNYALFIDRALVEDGKPQIYGTRAKPFDQWLHGQPILYPITDEANVDKRRANVGLPPLTAYLEELKRMYYPRHRQ